MNNTSLNTDARTVQELFGRSCLLTQEAVDYIIGVLWSLDLDSNVGFLFYSVFEIHVECLHCILMLFITE